jgi:hypothetical protein
MKKPYPISEGGDAIAQRAIEHRGRGRSDQPSSCNIRLLRVVSTRAFFLRGRTGQFVERRSARFRSLFLCMSSSQNRCTFLGDMH